MSARRPVTTLRCTRIFVPGDWMKSREDGMTSYESRRRQKCTPTSRDRKATATRGWGCYNSRMAISACRTCSRPAGLPSPRRGGETLLVVREDHPVAEIKPVRRRLASRGLSACAQANSRPGRLRSTSAGERLARLRGFMRLLLDTMFPPLLQWRCVLFVGFRRKTGKVSVSRSSMR